MARDLPHLPDRTPWALIGALYAAGLVAAGQFAKVSLTLPALALAYPDAPVAFAVSGVAVMGILFGVMAGGITASLGPRRAILAALALSALAGAGQAVLPPFAALMALRVLEGAGHLVLVVAIPTLMAGLAAPRDRGLVMGIWATFFGVGFALAALVVGQDAGVVYGTHAGLAALLGLVLWRMLPPRVATAPRPLPRLADHVAIYRTPRLFAPALGHGTYAFLFLALVTFLPAALGAPWLAAVLPLVGLAGSLAVGPLTRLVAPGALVAGGFAAMAALFAAALVLPGLAVPLVVAGMLVSGVIAGGGFAAVPWLNGAEADRALANGALAQLGNIGTFSGTPVLAALGAGASLPMAIAVGVFGAAATALAYRAAARVNVR
ncbi:MFS transporter [Roseicyclus persicicus]|uniref:MFS transporter n=1 Tax=Roseicyclus persicicus TaxID=2650661 RepID=A0A7X6H3C7_9RHOB|nr:MFS transporter [Roseibacterium persicicum]NKX46403.1 MFS transporter [Roseibacterium persicicum]